MPSLSLLKNRNILVTGGAGYIGSHTSRQLVNAGCNVVVVDNFYSGHRWAVPKEALLIEGDAGDLELIASLLSEHHIEAVVHFAGHIVVPESVTDPLKYHRNNTCCSLNLIAACTRSGVHNFVFSSSAAVYGIPSTIPVAETAPTSPINPYGRSKLMTEWMLEDTANSFISVPEVATQPQDRFRYVALRYFNVAGASQDGLLGQATPNASHLIKVACEAACGRRESVAIFGTDYPTPDGTCIRDYIHVDDLAQAHLLALAHLFAGGSSEILNCGYGTGFSVREILAAVKEVSGVNFSIIETERRLGDPPALTSDPHRLKELFAWQPTLQDIRQICKTAYKWEKTGLMN
ncbi:UDP-glucose 4-epimerase GalE [Thiovibrio frasassiensis]|uniref:UDP-glucose 4-epimerase n=1 Tax=Thiovibrio frasassiensis TaxID=2984131 RepID=A0A9X4RML4_9BACT|nr:UDP-glucose 4-epimerase GalE [Thiovibrio frasassiensis]MDG4476303.1 UDP-glucose 4-epimerase GalE [Thiovibrio frasassiensis]